MKACESSIFKICMFAQKGAIVSWDYDSYGSDEKNARKPLKTLTLTLAVGGDSSIVPLPPASPLNGILVSSPNV